MNYLIEHSINEHSRFKPYFYDPYFDTLTNASTIHIPIFPLPPHFLLKYMGKTMHVLMWCPGKLPVQLVGIFHLRMLKL